MYQKVIAIGRISEPQTSESGKMMRFGIATQMRKDSDTEWFNCRILSEGLIKAIGPYLEKGKLLYIEGHQETVERDGKRYTNLIVSTLRLMPNGGSGGGNGGDSSSGGSGGSSNGNSSSGEAPGDFEDDIPF